MIAFNGVWIAVVLTVVLIGIALRPMNNPDPVGLAYFARLLWLVPALAVWLVYLGLRVWGGA